MKQEKRMLYAILIGLIIAIPGILIVSAVAGYGPLRGVVHPTWAWEEWGITAGLLPPCGNFGDVNDDGLVTTRDRDLIRTYFIEGWSAVDPDTPLSEDMFRYRADVNGDDEVTSADGLLLAEYGMGNIDTFPVCGTMDGYLISSQQNTGPFTPGGTANLGWFEVGNNPLSATGAGIMHMKLMQNQTGTWEGIATYSQYLAVGGTTTFTMTGIPVPDDSGSSWNLAVYVYGEDELRFDVNRDGVCDGYDLNLVSYQMGWTGVPGAIPEDVTGLEGGGSVAPYVPDGTVDLIDVRCVSYHDGWDAWTGAGTSSWTAYISGVTSPWAWILGIVFGVASVGVPFAYYKKGKRF